MSDDSLDLAAGLPPALLAAAIDGLGHSAALREQTFDSLCATHPEFEPKLRRMFADFVSVERLLDGGYGGAEETPAHIGPYHVVRRLGDGAFGEVFLCQQVEPVRREVAVKVLRAGAGDRATLLRFAAERQLIASLQHPAIAQVFDAGTLADGRPFFVMDAIDGTPIDRFCDEQKLTVEARVELFCHLCHGVQHAHDRGIVHRDLKPANVLVVEVDGRPRPKVIDFGIAKVLRSSSVARAFDTEAGRVVGTPGYMSPEQQRGSSDAVDARADVFGLGVMLYELLCGELPWPAGAAATDADPQRPSTRVSTSAAKATAIARHRSTEPRRLAGRLRGDIDWIVLKCLQRAPEHRYRTAQELIEDLERHQRGEPVRAGPPSTTYRLQKFVRRHRSLLGVVAGLLCAALLGTWMLSRYADAASASETKRQDELAASRALFVRGNYAPKDYTAMASIAESLVRPDADWDSLHHGIRGFDQAAELALRGGHRDVVPALRRRLAAACEQLLAAPVASSSASSSTVEPASAGDPLRVCAVAQARVRLAALLEPGERAERLLRDGVAALDAMRSGDPTAWWDERLWVDASLAVARADVSAGEPRRAAERLEMIGEWLRGRIQLVAATGLWLQCCDRAYGAPVPDPALGELACDSAITTLDRAIDNKAHRSVVLALPGINRLQQHPRGREVLARLPE